MRISDKAMKYRKSLCVLLGLLTVMAVGCSKPANNNTVSQTESQVEQMTAPDMQNYEEVKTFYGESASYGNMTVTVSKMEDPGIVMENTGKMAVFFEVTIDNDTEETVTTNYLNNFAMTVDGTYYEPKDCFTIPVMKKLYDATGQDAFQGEIAPGESMTAFLAAEVAPEFQELALHYIPKTTDRGSRVTVELTRDDMTKAE